MDDMMLLRNILTNDWIVVKAMVTPSNSATLLDVVFITTDGETRLTGRAHSLRDTPEEVFTLAIYEHVKRGWWQEDESGRTGWKPRNLSEEWATQSMGSMLSLPRDVRFYSDPRLRDRTSRVEGVLDDCAAIEFIKVSAEAGKKRLVLAASNANPCEVELGTTTDTCDMLLRGLTRMTLNVA